MLAHSLKYFSHLTLYTLQILENHHLVYIHTRIITELYFSKQFSKLKRDNHFVYIHTRIITKLNSPFKTFPKHFSNTFSNKKNISD